MRDNTTRNPILFVAIFALGMPTLMLSYRVDCIQRDLAAEQRHARDEEQTLWKHVLRHEVGDSIKLNPPMVYDRKSCMWKVDPARFDAWLDSLRVPCLDRIERTGYGVYATAPRIY